MIRASGVMFVSMNGNALFLKRGPTAPDCPDCWDFPGGGQEGDETAEQTAIRETREEIGFVPDGERLLHTRTASPGANGVGVGVGVAEALPVPLAAPVASPPLVPMPPVDYSTFIQRVTNEFTPELDGEHTGFAWAPLDSPPEPLHPGCRIALERLDMNELDVAHAIADGRLTSPQRYENVWLFAIRVTGTSVAYRPKHEEFVLRSAEHWTTTDALARCNGMPVIFKHPKKSPLLNSEEFSNRIVGTIFLPYVAGTEVWAIAKIYVDAAAEMMAEGGLSTSPGVNFSNFKVNATLTVENGSKVLVEGDPSLFDHVAICELGVWDKGGEPTGIRAESREDSAMTEDEKKAAEEKAKKDAAEKEESEKKAAADKAKKDADEKERKDGDAGVGEKLDKVLSHLDSTNNKMDAIGKRLDAVEGKDKEAEEKAKKDAADKEEADKKAAADAAKKDSDDKEAEEKKKREDAAKIDSADVRKRIDEVAAMIPKAVGDSDYIAMTDAQVRADEVYAMFGDHAPRPQHGETPALYERRIVRDLKKHSDKWGKVDVTTAFADDAAFATVRDDIYGDAKKAAMSPSTAPDGGLRAIKRRGESGHTIIEYVGDSRGWLYPFSGAARQYAQGRFDDTSIRK